MIGVSVRSNIREVSAEFSALKDRIADQATVRALNRALDQAATEANRRIRDVYNVKARAVAAAIKKRRARRGSPSAALEISGVRLGLIEFDARQTRKMTGTSVRIKVAGGRSLVRHAFITTLAGGANAGYRGVFVREGKQSYPIKALRSLSVPRAFLNKVVQKAVKQVARDSFVRNYRQQIKYLSER